MTLKTSDIFGLAVEGEEDNGKYNGNYYSVLGKYGVIGNYYSILGNIGILETTIVYWGYKSRLRIQSTPLAEL